MLALVHGAARAEVAPEQGGGLWSLTVEGRPALSAGAGRPDRSPFALALNLLLPFSNRISGGGFEADGRFHALSPNLDGEPFPIHGDAFQRPWVPVSHTESEAVLRLSEGAFGPFRYEAEVAYRLASGRLRVDLSLVSRSEVALPWGLGFHPWFPRSPGTRLRFEATSVWPQDDRHLPATREPRPIPEAWDFSTSSALPPGWLNTAFAGWDGEAEIRQDGAAVPLRLSAPGLGTLIVYSPSGDAPFLCVEPVSHPVDAHNLPGRPGLVRLAPGEALGATMTLSWGAGNARGDPPGGTPHASQPPIPTDPTSGDLS
jgi:aldose 1-epimerase